MTAKTSSTNPWQGLTAAGEALKPARRPGVRAAAIGVVVTTLAACAAPGLYVKKDLVYGDLVKTLNACHQQAQRGATEKAPNTAGTVTTGGLAGGVGAGLSQGIIAGRVEDWYHQDCMEQRGYRRARITSEEWDRFKSLKGEDEKLTFLKQLYREVANGTRKTL